MFLFICLCSLYLLKKKTELGVMQFIFIEKRVGSVCVFWGGGRGTKLQGTDKAGNSSQKYNNNVIKNNSMKQI